MNDPIDFARLAWDFWAWVSSPTTVLLLSLSYTAWTIATFLSKASETEAPKRKDGPRVR